jgi:predicted nucleic acid-binding protein
MRIFFDTSALVAAFVESHPAHEASLARLNAVRKGRDAFLVAGHTLAELYAVLTRLPVSPRINPVMAHRLIEENTRDAGISVLSAREYKVLLTGMVKEGLTGGVIYDALILQSAIKAKADVVITLNPADFNRVQGSKKCLRIVAP